MTNETERKPLVRHTVCLAALALLGACSSGGSSGDPSAGAPAPADHPFRYEVPSPPTATYQVADTNTMIMSMPQGETDMAMSSSATVTLTFTADPAGLRVVGAVSDHSASMASSMMEEEMDVGGGDLTGDLEFTIGPLGHVEMISTPEAAAAGGLPATPFAFVASDLFPRFPGHALEPGDTWADSTTVAEDPAEAEELGLAVGGETEVVYTYTLVGDTTVGGRTLHKITLSGVSTSQAEITEAETGGGGATDMVNTVNGFYLWDADRRLVVLAELVRTVDGIMSMPGMGEMSMTMAGPSSMRLVN